MGGKVGKTLKEAGKKVASGVEHVASYAVHEAVKIGEQAAAKAMAANDGPLSSADMEFLQTRWSHMTALASSVGITIPNVELPTHSSDVAAFIDNIHTFEEQLRDYVNEGMQFFTDMRKKYPCDPNAGLYDRAALTSDEKEMEQEVSDAADSIGLDAALDFEVTANASSDGKVATIGVNPDHGSATIEQHNAKPMESPHGLPNSATPAKFVNQSARSKKPVSSEIMCANGVHEVYVEKHAVRAATQMGEFILSPTNSTTGDVRIIKPDGTAVNNPLVLGASVFGKRYYAYAGVIPDEDDKLSTPFSSSATTGGTFLVSGNAVPPAPPDDGILKKSSVNYTFPRYVTSLPPADASSWQVKTEGTKVTGNVADASGTTITLGNGVKHDERLHGTRLYVHDVPKGGQDAVLRPGIADFDSTGTIVESYHVALEIKVTINVPPYYATGLKSTFVGLWIKNVDTLTCHYKQWNLKDMGGDFSQTGFDYSAGALSMDYHMRVAVGIWQVTSMIFTTDEYEIDVAAGTTAPLLRKIPDGYCDHEEEGRSYPSALFQRVRTRVVTTERAGQVAVADQMEVIENLAGDSHSAVMREGIDAWYQPHFAHGGAHAVSRNHKAAAPSDNMARVRAAVGSDLVDRSVDAAPAAKKWAAWTGDETWTLADWSVIHTPSIESWKTAPQATVSECGWEHMLARLVEMLNNTTATNALEFLEASGDPVKLLKELRYVFGPAINLSSLFKAIGYGGAAEMASVITIRLTNIMIPVQGFLRIKNHAGTIADSGIAATVASSSIGEEINSQIVGKPND